MYSEFIGLWSGNDDLMTSCCFIAGKDSVDQDEASSIIIKPLLIYETPQHLVDATSPVSKAMICTHALKKLGNGQPAFAVLKRLYYFWYVLW